MILAAFQVSRQVLLPTRTHTLPAINACIQINSPRLASAGRSLSNRAWRRADVVTDALPIFMACLRPTKISGK